MKIKKGKKKRPWVRVDLPPELGLFSIWEEAWVKGKIGVLIRRNLETPWGRMHHAMFGRNDLSLMPHQWSTLQKAKNELFGAESEAIELYPAESRKRDKAHSYHLYVLADGAQVPMGAEAGQVFTE